MLNSTDTKTSHSLEEGELPQINIVEKVDVVPMEEQVEESSKDFGQVVDAKTILKKKSYKLNHDDSDSSSTSSSSSSSSSSSRPSSKSPLRTTTQSSLTKSSRKLKKNKNPATSSDNRMNCCDDQPPEDPTTTTRKKRFDVWSSVLQVDTLMEDMRGINVTRNFHDRSVENYDYNLPYRLNRERFVGERFDNDNDDDHDDDDDDDADADAEDHKDFQSELRTYKKRMQRKRMHDQNSMNDNIEDDSSPVPPPSKISRQKNSQRQKNKSAARRLRQQRKAFGRRNTHPDNSDEQLISDCSDSTEMRKIRLIPNMNDVSNRSVSDVAMEMATKLHEKNLDLMVKIVEVMGIERSLKVFEETQRIEAKGGMDIHSGARRRTSGGIFMLLVRMHDDLTPEEKKNIFKRDTMKPLQNPPNPFREEEVKETTTDETIKLTSITVTQDEQDSMEEGECSPESNKCPDDYLPNPPPSPNYPF